MISNGSLGGDGLENVEADGPDRGQDGRDDTGDRGDDEYGDDRAPRDRQRLQALAAQAALEGDPESQTHERAQHRAEQGSGDGFDRDRPGELAAGEADGAQQADLPCAFEDRQSKGVDDAENRD